MHTQPKHTLVSLLRGGALCLIALLAAGCGAAPAPIAAPTTLASAAVAPVATVAIAVPIAAAAPTAALSSSTAPAQLTYAFPDDAASIAAATQLIAAYASAHPGVQITARPLAAADYAQQLLASLDTSPPDLFMSVDAQAAALIKRNAVLDLQPLLANRPDFKAADFQPAALAAWQRGDSLYALPADVMPKVLFYNQDLFDASGVAYPTAGWTWDDWLSSAKKLTVSSGGQVTRYGTSLIEWSAMVWGNGGELLSADGTHTLLTSAEATAGVQFAADMVNVHKVAPPPKDAGGPDPLSLFEQQKVAMMPGASSLANVLLVSKPAFKWAIAPLPAGIVPAIPISVASVAISAHSPNQSAALDFAAWMVGAEGSAIKTNLLPFTAPALLAAAPRTGGVLNMDAILQELQHGRTLPQIEAWPQVKSLIDQALKPVWLGQETVAAAYRKVEPDVDALLKTA